MLRNLILAAGVAFALLTPAYAADPQTFKTEDSATAFCKTGNVVWFNPASKIYFPPGSQFYGKTKAGGFTAERRLKRRGLVRARGTERELSLAHYLTLTPRKPRFCYYPDFSSRPPNARANILASVPMSSFPESYNSGRGGG